MAMTQLLAKYILKINSSFKYGQFAINPETGIITFKANSNFHLNWQHALEKENFKTLLRTQVNTIAQAIKFHTVKLLTLGNWLSQTQYDNIVKGSASIRKISEDVLKILRQIQQYYSSCTSLKVPDTLEKETKITANNLPTKILTQITLAANQPQEQTLIQQGGFSRIYLKQVSFQVNDQSNLMGFEELKMKALERYLVIKEERTERNMVRRIDEEPSSQEAAEKNRIKNEAKILDLIGEKENMNIARYFKDASSNQPKIMMEYYPHKSLESFMMSHYHLSMSTKMWFLIQIVHGLKFLGDADILHLDLKPGNIMLTRNYLCKLIDFGESYHNVKGAPTGFRPGKTYPYCPPEVTPESIVFNPKMDVFSFGVMMYEFLWDQMIVDYKKSNLGAINSKYQRGTYKIKFLEDNVSFFGPKHAMKLLRLLILFCTEPTADARPSLQYLVVILKTFQNFLDKMY
jgi:tRNA A-37 threonylcarbamoyl transferase component Bud32